MRVRAYARADSDRAARGAAGGPTIEGGADLRGVRQGLHGDVREGDNKPSEQASKQSILDNYLLPRFRTRRLDSFKVLDIDQLERLVAAAKDEPERRAMILLGAEAGMRMAGKFETVRDGSRRVGTGISCWRCAVLAR